MFKRASAAEPAQPKRPAPPEFRSFRERAAWRREHGIRAVGPTVLRPSPPEPSRADRVVAAKRDSAVAAAHRATVEGELRAIAERVELIDRHLGAPETARTFGGEVLGGATAPAAPSYLDQELRAERRQLVQLYADIEGERERTITVDRNGRALTERDYAIVRANARAAAKLHREAAERAAAEGDHRRARQHSVDSYRGRHIAEFELGWRSYLAGYSQPWS